MKIPTHPSIIPGEFDPTHVRWTLTMIAEGLAFGLRLREAGLVPPSVDSAWCEPMVGRWYQLIAKAAGTDVFLEDGEEENGGHDEVVFVGCTSEVDGALDAQYAALLEREAWYWSLQEAAMEGAYNLTTLDAGLAVVPGEGPLLPEFASAWYQSLEKGDWELAPGVFPPPSLDTLTVQWLANATFELARRAGVPSLANLELAHEAARRAMDYVVCDQMVHGAELYRLEMPIEEEDFAR